MSNNIPNLSLPNNLSQGVFVNTYTIVDVKRPENKLDWTHFDLIFVVKDEKNNFEHNFRFTGKLYQNGNLPVNLSELLVACGILDVSVEERTKIFQEILDDKFPLDNLKNMCVNKKIKLLKYVYDKTEDGKLKYKFWNGSKSSLNNPINPFKIETSDEVIIKLFMNKVNSEYTVKDYRPELLTMEDNTQVEVSSNNVPF